MVYIMVALSQTKGVYKMFNVSRIDFKEYEGLYVEVSTNSDNGRIDLMKTESSNDTGLFIARFEFILSTTSALVNVAADLAEDIGVPLKIVS